MAVDLTLRRYRPADLQALFLLDQVCFPAPFRFSLRSMRQFAEAAGAISVVAHRAENSAADRSIVGFAIVHVGAYGDADAGYVATLDVAPNVRRMGVARRLMAEVERMAVEAGARRMILHVFTRNEGAIQVYEGLGYEPTGVVEGFYGLDRDGPLDAFVYGKELELPIGVGFGPVDGVS